MNEQQQREDLVSQSERANEQPNKSFEQLCIKSNGNESSKRQLFVPKSQHANVHKYEVRARERASGRARRRDMDEENTVSETRQREKKN